VKELVEDKVTIDIHSSWPPTRTVVRVVFIILLMLMVVSVALFIIKALTGVLLLVVLAIFFAYFVAPLVEFVSRPFHMRGQRRIMPRAAAIGIVYVIIFGSIGIASYILLPRLGNQITEFAEQSPTYLTSAKERAEKMNEFYQAYNLPEPVRKKASEWLSNVIGTVGGVATNGIRDFLLGLITLLPWLILIPILGFFLLKDADSFRRSALQMLPSGRWRWRGDEFFQDVNRTLAAYIRAQLIACLFIGTICTIAFLIIGVPYALLFGLMAALLEFIPLVGPLTVAAIVTPITGFYSIKQAMAVLIFLAVLRITHDYVIYPRIIGQGIHLHPLAVILAILSGAELAGITGIFLAIPVVAITTVTYRHWLEHRGSSGLVADLLKPESAAVMRTEMKAEAVEIAPVETLPDADGRTRPTLSTTPEEMEHHRPDLASGELKMPKLD
jgi:predicted PurR-regulated permease PerM